MTSRFISEIKIEQKRIQRLVSICGQNQPADIGSLYLARRGKRIYAYERWQQKGAPERKEYLGPLSSSKVKNHIAAKINTARLPVLLRNQKLLQGMEQEYEDDSFYAIISRMPPAYRSAATENSFNQRYEELKEWANAPYRKNTYPFSDAGNFAEDGTRLRSKGECIWYNLLQERGILFRNDCRMVFMDKDGNEKVLYPDFLIQCYDGTFIIIEHLGKMNDLGYAIDFGERSHYYLQGGFVLGKNYFVTSDDKNYGTDSEMIRRLVDRIEQMFYGF